MSRLYRPKSKSRNLGTSLISTVGLRLLIDVVHEEGAPFILGTFLISTVGFSGAQSPLSREILDDPQRAGAPPAWDRWRLAGIIKTVGRRPDLSWQDGGGDHWRSSWPAAVVAGRVGRRDAGVPRGGGCSTLVPKLEHLFCDRPSGTGGSLSHRPLSGSIIGTCSPST